MGNTKSTKVKELYYERKFDVIYQEFSDYIGVFRIISFDSFKNERFVQKTIDPFIYDVYSDINSFTKSLSTTNPNICDFFFIDFNQSNREIYDLIFEYGESIQNSKFEEKQLWGFIKNILNGLWFLEENNFHYPKLSKEFVIKTTDGNLKLVNPHCFSEYIKDILEIYLNPQNPISNRISYSKSRIRTNVEEFGFLILSLIDNYDIVELKNNHNYLISVLNIIFEKMNSKFYNLIVFKF